MGLADRFATVPPIDSIPADLVRTGLMGKFSADSEADYQMWVGEQIAPLLRMVALVSIPVWLSLPWLSRLIQDSSVDTWTWITCLVNTVVIAGSIVVSYKAPRRTIAVGMAVLAVVGVDGMVVLATSYAATSPGGVVVCAVSFAYLTQFGRAPVRISGVVTLILIGTALGILIHFVATTDVGVEAAWPYFFFLVATVPLILGNGWVGENQLRSKYVDEQVIAHQQALLVESRRLIRRYAPPTVADLIEHGESASVDAPQRRRVTVLFSDVVGFTDLADRLDPESLSQVVNDYLATLAVIIERHRGTLNEFAGDGVMAIFGAPAELDPDEQVAAAVAAAREIQTSLHDLNRAWLKLGVDQNLRTRIGINTGVLSVGSFGSEGRATYTGIGLQTNIAARIQAQCEPGGILLSHASWQLVKETIQCEPRGEIMVKGVHFPIEVFAPFL